MKGRFTIAGDCDDIKWIAGFLHGFEFGFEIGGGLLTCGQSGGAFTLGVVTGFAIEAVEGAYLAVVRHEIDT